MLLFYGSFDELLKKFIALINQTRYNKVWKPLWRHWGVKWDWWTQSPVPASYPFRFISCSTNNLPEVDLWSSNVLCIETNEAQWYLYHFFDSRESRHFRSGSYSGVERCAHTRSFCKRKGWLSPGSSQKWVCGKFVPGATSGKLKSAFMSHELKWGIFSAIFFFDMGH